MDFGVRLAETVTRAVVGYVTVTCAAGFASQKTKAAGRWVGVLFAMLC
jgi:hypothetical protein